MTLHNCVRVLHVEDDPDIQVIVRLALESVGGLTVHACSSGAEALETGPAFDPDIILLDLMMPEMDGVQTLIRLREIPEMTQVPIVFMTAKVQPLEIARLKELGAADVLMKPFDPMTLAASVRSIWARLQEG